MWKELLDEQKDEAFRQRQKVDTLKIYLSAKSDQLLIMEQKVQDLIQNKKLEIKLPERTSDPKQTLAKLTQSNRAREQNTPYSNKKDRNKSPTLEQL